MVQGVWSCTQSVLYLNEATLAPHVRACHYQAARAIRLASTCAASSNGEGVGHELIGVGGQQLFNGGVASINEYYFLRLVLLPETGSAGKGNGEGNI
jgi:hypothetical protein